MITAENVEKRYMFKKAIQGSQKKKCAVHALRDICFTISPGETVGLIGKNGAGKSTLLKLISGVTVPDQGRIRVGGRVHALLELGTGFHPEYTGIENLYLNGALHGRSKAQTKALIPKILDFAEIGAYADQPIKTYSDGMFLRLAFAAAVAEEPEVFVIDEALAVGDVMFQAKCFRRMEAMKKQGTTILYVSHDIDSVRRFCDRAIWLDQGRIKMDGAVGDVTAAYLAAVLGDDAKDAVCGRFGSAVGLIQEVNVPPRWTYGRSVTISVRFTLPSDGAEDAALSVSVKNPEGLDLLVLTTRGQQKLTGGTQTVGFRFDSPFLDGDYILAVGLEKSGNAPISYYDYDGFAAKIKTCADGGFGVFHISAEVEAHAE